MAESALRDTVLKRLADAPDKQQGNEWHPYVLAALEGSEELARQIDDEEKSETPPHGIPLAAVRAALAGESATAARRDEQPTTSRVAFLRSITVEGFRGIGRKATLDLAPGPGLTLVVGRNGSGKSSFAEGLELLLTSQTYRWKERSAVGKDGFRNLHHRNTALAATLAFEGEKGTLTVAREWAYEAVLEEGETWAQVHGKPRTTLESLGWTEALESYRPFLSYHELGEMLVDAPSQLYNALAKILGLEDLVRAQNVLTEARSARENAQEHVEKERRDLLHRLGTSGDPRSTQTRVALGKKRAGLAELESVALPSNTGGSEGEIELLRRLSVLHVAPVGTARQIVQAVRDAVERERIATAGIAGRADDLGDLVERALDFHAAHGDGDCPVCGRTKALDPAWHQHKTEELEQLHEAAREVSEARRALAVAYADLRKLTAGEWPLLERASHLPLGKVREVAKGLLRVRDTARVDAIEDPAALAEAVDRTIPAYTKLLVALHVSAASELARREDAWRPIAQRIAKWLPRARAAYYEAPKLALLKTAEDWLTQTAETIRNDRFARIADHALRTWDQLKLQSNVSLAGIQLRDHDSNRPSVDLDVTVDGQRGAALGVMSQGELHSLALSLFIPRATLPESPFRFIVIDDPVQSMDPARVECLARVLQTTAKDRQVLVFTHDDRLTEAVQRLAVGATVIEVTRRQGSIVETRYAQG